MFMCSGCSTIDREALRLLSPRSKKVQNLVFPQPSPPLTLACATGKFFWSLLSFFVLGMPNQINLQPVNSATWRFSFRLCASVLYSFRSGQDTGHHVQRWFFGIMTRANRCWPTLRLMTELLTRTPESSEASSNLTICHGFVGNHYSE
jgi:hypothetical protein